LFSSSSFSSLFFFFSFLKKYQIYFKAIRIAVAEYKGWNRQMLVDAAQESSQCQVWIASALKKRSAKILQKKNTN